MLRTFAVAAVGCIVSCPCIAQPLPGAEEATQMVRAAGVPLQVSDLPAGTLTVRLVRGAFIENLSGRAVLVEISGGRAEEATTDEEGRATFTLAPGVQARATAMVDGERLESDLFAVPSTGGVRVLLVAGGVNDAAGAEGASDSRVVPPGHPPIAESPAPSVAPVAGNRAANRMAATGMLGSLTLATALIFMRRAWRRQ